MQKYKKYILLFVCLFFLIILNVEASTTSSIDYASFCSLNGPKKAMKIIGYIILVIRWIVPFIIVILGMVDYGKASLSNDEQALQKATGALFRRLIAGVIIFFVPTIILAILNIIEVTKGIEDKDNTHFGACTKCLFDPLGACEITNSGL